MQSNFVYEDLIYRIADHIGKSVKDVQELNFYRTGDVLPCERDGTSLGDLKEVNLQRCWRELHEKAKVEGERGRERKEFLHRLIPHSQRNARTSRLSTELITPRNEDSLARP
jgi:hypothetical protein